jgi:hypothetical protein
MMISPLPVVSLIRVLVTSDFEHKCFNINFEVVQNILQQISTLLKSEDLKNARDILAALGIGWGGLSAMPL